MRLSILLLSLTLIFWAAIGFGWLVWTMNVVYGFALITGIMLILEETAVFTWRGPVRKV